MNRQDPPPMGAIGPTDTPLAESAGGKQRAKPGPKSRPATRHPSKGPGWGGPAKGPGWGGPARGPSKRAAPLPQEPSQ